MGMTYPHRPKGHLPLKKGGVYDDPITVPFPKEDKGAKKMSDAGG